MSLFCWLHPPNVAILDPAESCDLLGFWWPQESFVPDSSRWRVKVSGAMKDLKAENLRLLDLEESQAP